MNVLLTLMLTQVQDCLQFKLWAQRLLRPAGIYGEKFIRFCIGDKRKARAKKIQWPRKRMVRRFSEPKDQLTPTKSFLPR